jgi:hypothetical protein
LDNRWYRHITCDGLFKNDKVNKVKIITNSVQTISADNTLKTHHQ